MHRFHTRSIAVSTSLLVAGTVLAGELTIADIAPQNAFMAIGVDDFQSWKASFDRAGFGAILDDERVKTWFADASEEFLPQMKKDLAELGIDFDELSWPTGAVGMAAWIVDNDFESSNGLVFADFGENAEAMDEMIVEAFERGADQDSIELRDEDVDGVTVWGVKGIAVADEADFDDLDAGFIGDLTPAQPEEFFYGRSGDYLFVASSLAIAGDALRVIDGDDRQALRDSNAFQSVRGRVDGNEMYGVFVTAPLLQAVDAAIAAGAEGFDAQAQSGIQLMRAIGLEDFIGGGFSLAFDTDDAALESKFAVLTGGKDGLWSLLDAEPMPFDPPAFISPDAATATMMRVNFDRIIPLYNQVVAALPPEEQANMQQMGAMFVPMLEPILANIGPDVVIGTYFQRPFSIDSQKQTWAIRAKDQQALTQALAGVFPMLGFQPRDFQGQQIWSPAPGGFIPEGQFAIGVGSGFLFLGPTVSVENAMRPGAGAEGLADEDRFRTAVRVLDGGGTMYSYSDTAQSLEWGEWYLKNFDKILAEQMAAFEIDGEEMDEQMRADIEDMARQSTPMWLRTMPPLEIIGEHFGDSVTEMKPTPNGFEGRMLWLRPAK